jgi:hypothetical protein
MDKNKLISIIKKSLKTTLPINVLFTIDIQKNNKQYEKLIHKNYKSNIKKHLINMKDLSKRDAELYLINNKLDKYYHLFNPVNYYYDSIQRTKNINHKTYYNHYFKNTKVKDIVNNYLLGFKWIFQYYFKRNQPIDETWYYPYFKAPLFHSMIDYYNSNIIDRPIQYKKLDIRPLEQVLYITPIKISDLSKPTAYMLFAKYSNNKFENEQFVKNIKQFIESHPEFFYNLDEIYYSVKSGSLEKDLFDCSNSNYISKCHYTIFNYIVDIKRFVMEMRKYVN